MQDWIRIVGSERTVEILGVRLVGINAETGTKVLFTIVFVVLVVMLGRLAQVVRRKLQYRRTHVRVRFWGAQGIKLATAIIMLVGLISIWFDDPARLTTGLGLVTAGLAFALQRVVSALAGYFVILRGNVFNVGDRIVMGGVRGDVIALDFTKTTIMEMGQPPPVQGAEPPIWVQSREYTGRIVTVTNAKIFDEPVYNYTRDFPYLWEELSLPISYGADHERAERLLLAAAERHTVPISELSQDALQEMQRRFVMKPADMGPRVYYRLTDNWLELTVRFIALDHGIRRLKDAMSRDILRALDEAQIAVASPSFAIARIPPLRIASGQEEL